MTYWVPSSIERIPGWVPFDWGVGLRGTRRQVVQQGLNEPIGDLVTGMLTGTFCCHPVTYAKTYWEDSLHLSI